jgi:hypothetical protein
MKHGITFEDLATEVERQSNAKRDFLVPSQQMEVRTHLPGYLEEPDAQAAGLLDGILEEAAERRDKRRAVEVEEAPRFVPRMDLGLPSAETFPLTPHAHGQLAARLDIPTGHYRRLMLPENRDVYQQTVNHFLKQSTARRLFRTLDGIGRADLSDAYRDLDNFQLLQAILPVLSESGCRMMSCDVTATKLYLKVVSPDLEGEVGQPEDHRVHAVQGGLVVTNSEIGMGKLTVEGLLNVRACTNALWTGASFRKTHLGRRLGADMEEAREFFSDETKAADDKAFFLKTRDVVGGILSHEAFQGTLDRMNGAAESAKVEDPVGAVEVAQRAYSWTDDEARKIRTAFIEQRGDFGLGKWGLAQAVTQVAQDDELTYDRASELEQQAGQVIELPKRSWDEFVKAVA